MANKKREHYFILQDPPKPPHGPRIPDPRRTKPHPRESSWPAARVNAAHDFLGEAWTPQIPDPFDHRPSFDYSLELSFNDAVKRSVAERGNAESFDQELEDYLVEASKNYAADPNREDLGLPPPDWKKRGEKVTHEMWQDKNIKPYMSGETPSGHYDHDRRPGSEPKGYPGDTGASPIIRHFKSAYNPFVHEGFHHLTQDSPSDPRKFWSTTQMNGMNILPGTPPKWASKQRPEWTSNPNEIIADAAEAKRKLLHGDPSLRAQLWWQNERKKKGPQRKAELPEWIVDEILEEWMLDANEAERWYDMEEEDLPKKIGKEAIKLSKASSTVPGLFTGEAAMPT